jgi:hypothetical protein
MVTGARKQPAGGQRAAAGAVAPPCRRKAIGGQPRGLQSGETPLSQTDIATLAGEMQVPEGILHLVLRHYPELARPLARRRDWAVRSQQ